jgi:acetyl-CoA acetyltransferase
VTSVLVAGVGCHLFGRFGSTYEELAESAATEALQDAGVAFSDVDLTVVASVGGGVGKAQRVAARLGATGRPVYGVESACASSALAMSIARDAILAGTAQVVLCIGVEKTPRGFVKDAGFQQWQTESGLGVPPVYFALQAQELMLKSDVTLADLAAVSVKNHANGVHNPRAMYRAEMTSKQVLDSPAVCSPLTLFMLCTPNEGAAAAVLMSPDASRRYGSNADVRLAALSVATRTPEDWFVPAPSRLSGSHGSVTRTAAGDAFAESGLRIDDIDLIECQDTDSASELLAYSDLGLCGPGEEGALLRSGDTARDGRIPVNVSGGLLAKGEPLGASGLGQIHELVLQLRGQAGERQVTGARVGLAHMVGAGPVSAVSILQAAA